MSVFKHIENRSLRIQLFLMKTRNHRHYFIFICTKSHLLLIAARFYMAVIVDGSECYITRSKVLVL